MSLCLNNSATSDSEQGYKECQAKYSFQIKGQPSRIKSPQFFLLENESYFVEQFFAKLFVLFFQGLSVFVCPKDRLRLATSIGSLKGHSCPFRRPQNLLNGADLAKVAL